MGALHDVRDGCTALAGMWVHCMMGARRNTQYMGALRDGCTALAGMWAHCMWVHCMMCVMGARRLLACGWTA